MLSLTNETEPSNVVFFVKEELRVGGFGPSSFLSAEDLPKDIRLKLEQGFVESKI